MIDSDGVSTLLRDRLLQVVSYLDEVISRNEVPDRTLSADRTVHSLVVPDELPGCELYPGESWLRLVKVPEPDSVAVPPVLDPLIHSVRHDPGHEPELMPDWERRAEESGLSADQVQLAYETWRDRSWRPWAKLAGEARCVTQAFTSVRALALELERRESDLELVWGHGIIHGRVGGEVLRYPLVTTPVEIAVDPETGYLHVRPTGPTRLEVAALSGLPTQGIDDLQSLSSPGGVVGFDPLDEEARAEFFGRALMALGGQPRVRRPGDGVLGVAWQGGLWVDDAFAITLRPRFSNVRGFLADLREHATAGGALDFTGIGAMAALLHEEPSSIVDPADPAESWSGSTQRPLMPLETNEDQEKIARELGAKKLVAVQGPPGTGKTHTIANLISHLVAHGKRVLVVAHKEEPLSEVRDKIPASLRALSVALMGASATQVNQMQAAVRQLMGVGSPTEAPAAAQRVDQVATALDAAIVKRGRLQASLRAIAARDGETLEVAGLELRPLQVGEWLGEHRDDGWLADRFAYPTACPLSVTEVDEFLRLVHAINLRDRLEAQQHLPGRDPLPTGTALSTLHADLDRLRDLEQALRARGLARDAHAHSAETFEDLRDRAAALATSITARPAWLVHLASSVANPATRDSYGAQIARLQQDVDSVARLALPLAGHAVTVDRAHVDTPREHVLVLTQLREQLTGKGSVSVFSRDLKRAQKRNLVDGEGLHTGQDVALVIAAIQTGQTRQALALRWNQLAAQHSGPPAASAFPEHEVTANLGALRQCLAEESVIWATLRAALDRVVTSSPPEADALWLAETSNTLDQARALPRLQQLEASLSELTPQLRSGALQPTASALWASLQDALAGRQWGEWDSLLAEAARLRELTGPAVRCAELARQLAAVAPATADAIGALAQRPTSGADLVAAWEWRSTAAWLDSVIGTEEAASIGAAANDARGEIRRLIESLAEASARYALITGMTDRQRRALADWSAAIGKIGKGGSSKSAGHWTAVAQQKMQDAVEGVPVWIMSWQRALTQFRGGTTPFDVVIVDEASQCDIRSLLVLTLGKRAVVVGDDKQISPTSFVPVELVRDLIDRHLRGVPSANFYEPSESMFNRAVSASNGALTLSEHFRCVPEIINFCSQRWYDGRIQPLRAGAGAFAEPFRVVHTPEGIRGSLTGYGADVNQAEADALVDTVVELSRDPAYRDKTFGVISLLSSAKQEVYLQHKLLARLGEAEYARRRLKVGGSYTFQGAERDVIFVSMVVDSNKRFGAFTGLDDQRRVNVAASRARDQVWIFHSATLPEFNKDDIRRSWIEYASSGFSSQQQFDNLEDLCESGFEKDVLRQIVERGYAPVPQFRIGKYRIDFVIPLRNGARIAIECDGDAYHQDLDADMARQAILERVGRCEFFRVRGSVYGRDPVKSLDPLWRLLEDRGAPRWQQRDEPAESGAELRPQDHRYHRASEARDETPHEGTNVAYVAEQRSRTAADEPTVPEDRQRRPDGSSGFTGEPQATTRLGLQMGSALSVRPDGSAEMLREGVPGLVATGEPFVTPLVSPPAGHVDASGDGARGEILAAIGGIIMRSGSDTFTAQQVVDELARQRSPYAEGTIRTMISSHLCVQGYLVRVERGVFCLS